jgi:hypothetical protein
MTLRTIIFLSILFFSKNSFPQDWIYVGSSVNGDKYYVRNSAINNYSKKIWSKQVSKSMTYKKAGKTYTLVNGYCVDLKEYDCSGRQSKLISFAYYDSKGNVVFSMQFQDYESEWHDVYPDSVGEMLLDKVCELF